VVVTEVNPDHDPDGTLLEVLADVLADTIGTVRPAGVGDLS